MENINGAVRFGAFEVDLRTEEFRKHGLKLRLPRQSFQVLVLLVQCPGELVSREKLRERLWPADTFVDFDHGLNAAVNRLREALGDTAEEPRFIETLPRRGYRFIAALKELEAVSESAVHSGFAVAEEPPVVPIEHPAGEAGVTSQARPGLRKFWIVVLALAAAFAIVLGLNLRAWRERLLTRSTSPRIRSLAVLPLENLSGDPNQDYLADGMTEELTTDLAKISTLRVISRISAMKYKGTKKALPQIASELKVDAVIEGAFQRSGDRVRITAQLIDAANDKHLWAESYERDLRDVLALQSEVARAIAREIKVKLTPDEQTRLTGARPVDTEAQNAYFKGRYELDKRTVNGLNKSFDYFEQAVRRDPGYAQAWAGLSDAYSQAFFLGISSPLETLPRAKAAAQKALELDETLSEAHVSLVPSMMILERSPSAAEKELQRAIALDPNNAEAHQYYSRHLAIFGRFDEAIAEAKLATQLDPLTSHHQNSLGAVLYCAGRYDEALQHFREVPDPDANFEPNAELRHRRMAQIYEQKGMQKEAVGELLTALRFAGNKELAAQVEREFLSSGYSEAKKTFLWGRIREAERRAKNGSLPMDTDEIAADYALLGEKDNAIKWLEKGIQGGTTGWDINVEPDFESLRSDPRFQDLLRRLGLSP